ncbi:GNAT family N-acetyltransferase [Streptomyces sp. NBC_00237]|uniref:GNAT family N-acetyltransferase n=1 Tax=Streptomyces sp. NBC_00237 TaxID=2975687 RepID=UPI002254A8ED|nr:GNAT family N-acetyltransferase [Streptomyces sp. NBC_00237]MCX5204294.1 GNAT family N-acetyltransferase [Streptomyces sp. NBC_00237]
MGVRIRQATGFDRDAVVRLVDEAFQDDPVSKWIFPDVQHYRRVHPQMMGGFFDQVLKDGWVDVTEDLSAVAMWLPTPAGEPGPDDGPAQLRAAVDPDNERVELVSTYTAAIHPHHREHAYLWIIGVDPERQGEGLGSALMAPVLDACDRDGTAAYLEASSERSRELYLRRGFADIGEPLRLPYGGPVMYPMWRDAQTFPQK